MPFYWRAGRYYFSVPSFQALQDNKSKMQDDFSSNLVSDPWSRNGELSWTSEFSEKNPHSKQHALMKPETSFIMQVSTWMEGAPSLLGTFCFFFQAISLELEWKAEQPGPTQFRYGTLMSQEAALPTRPACETLMQEF